MRNEDIEKLINQLNLFDQDDDFKIYKFKISSTVEVAKVWSIGIPSPLQFFLIKNNSYYVGAVNVLSNDLHWYILKEHRKKGYLTNALKEYILPYLFEIRKVEVQKIMITNRNSEDDYISSLSVAKKIGFHSIGTDSFELRKGDFQYSFSKNTFSFDGLDEIECKKLTDELDAISIRLEQINTQVEYAFGLHSKDYQKPDLRELAAKVKSRQWTIEDMLFDYNNKLKM
jgi:hypothetical protein